LQDIEHGHGVGVIDPAGDLAEDILDSIPAWRTDDVVYFNPADLDYPIGLNLLEKVPAERRHRIASGVVGAMKAIWRDSWGARMEYILYAAVAALLDCENTSILGIQRMLVDRRYRYWVVKQIKDPIVKSFWTREFENYGNQFMQEAIAPIQNKVGQLLMSPPLRNVLGQVKRKVDPRFMMDIRTNCGRGRSRSEISFRLAVLLPIRKGRQHRINGYSLTPRSTSSLKRSIRITRT
jgi:hypothetical protein